MKIMYRAATMEDHLERERAIREAGWIVRMAASLLASPEGLSDAERDHFYEAIVTHSKRLEELVLRGPGPEPGDRHLTSN